MCVCVRSVFIYTDMEGNNFIVSQIIFGKYEYFLITFFSRLFLRVSFYMMFLNCYKRIIGFCRKRYV